MAKRFVTGPGTFQERKAARIAAGARKFTFRVVADSPDFSEVVELARPFESKREAMVFAYGQVNSSGTTAAHQELMRRGFTWLARPLFTVYRQDEGTGERVVCLEEWVPSQTPGFVPSESVVVPEFRATKWPGSAGA